MSDAPVARIVSGGQTGVDRAALDVALRLGLACGGWCPAGRQAEDGTIDRRYPLRETPSPEPAQRTAWNVRDSDATLVLVRGEPAGGTAYTIAEAKRRRRPVLVVDVDRPPDRDEVRKWLRSAAAGTLNVAGPRESEAPGIHGSASGFLFHLLTTDA